MEKVDENIEPLFIFGLPKSGTSLTLALLEGHSNILAFPIESRFYQRLREKFKNVTPQVAADLILTESGFASFNPNSARFKKEFKGRELRYLNSVDYDVFRKELVKELGHEKN